MFDVRLTWSHDPGAKHMTAEAPARQKAIDILIPKATACFEASFGRPHAIATYAPGRIEVLGNHTDYNEGFVLSAAIHLGTCFLLAPNQGSDSSICAPDLDDRDDFDITSIEPGTAHPWSNYIKGMIAGLAGHNEPGHGFDAVIMSNLPIGSGLSSSAALEMASGLAIQQLYGLKVSDLELAKIGQKAEREYAGANTGLLDQLTSIYGRADQLVMSDFRSLDVEHIPFGDDALFLICNTGVAHANTDGQYNVRRENCERAAAHFEKVLDHEVKALRDVKWEEWMAHREGLDDTSAQHAAHPIGENERVVRGRELLHQDDLESFGELMYASHGSSIKFFENSCPELDFVVETSRHIPGILGARLSGGGFGGSALLLAHPRDSETIAHAMAQAFEKEFGRPCETLATTASDGARVLAS